jgi:hypothetical protein
MDKTLKSESTEGATRKRGISQVMEQSGGGFFLRTLCFFVPYAGNTGIGGFYGKCYAIPHHYQ